MADETQEVKFPIEFTACPNCGSTERMAGSILKKQQEEGKAGQDVKAVALTGKTIIADPRKINLAVPVLLTFLDICTECGTVYCVRAELGKGSMSTQSPPGGKLPPGIDLGKLGFPGSKLGLS